MFDGIRYIGFVGTDCIWMRAYIISADTKAIGIRVQVETEKLKGGYGRGG